MIQVHRRPVDELDEADDTVFIFTSSNNNNNNKNAECLQVKYERMIAGYYRSGI